MKKSIYFFIITTTTAVHCFGQRSITASYSSSGIFPTSGYTAISDKGIKTSSSKNIIPQKKDSTAVPKTTTIQLKNSTAALFKTIDSIIVYEKLVPTKPTICGGYGFNTYTYYNGDSTQLLFCLPSLNNYKHYNSNIKNEKNSTTKQRLVNQLNNATKLYNLYNKLVQQINTAL